MEFRSLAFLCDGVKGDGNEATTATITLVDPSGAGDIATTTSTRNGSPISSSTTSATAPLYTTPTTFSGNYAAPTATGSAVGTGGVVPPSPSPSPFLGAAVGRKAAAAWCVELGLGALVIGLFAGF